ncbi:MAG TPA: ImmA/IrrE family metallo-endopeptidase [Streptosporangiaceae bacterium]
MMLISTAFPRGHQRFTTAHELAHHLLRDPREIVIDNDLYDGGSPTEKGARTRSPRPCSCPSMACAT